MTVATLFTPKITPQFDAATDTISSEIDSAATGWDSEALDADVAVEATSAVSYTHLRAHET